MTPLMSGPAVLFLVLLFLWPRTALLFGFLGGLTLWWLA